MRKNHDLAGLQKILGLEGPIVSRLDRALTHGSVNETAAGVPSNAKLAHLGDAVLELAIRDRMFRDEAALSLGTLSIEKVKVVRNKNLARLARAEGLRLGEYIELGKGTEGERDTDSVLATALEAVLGAVFLEPDRGFRAASEAVTRILEIGAREGAGPSSDPAPS